MSKPMKRSAENTWLLNFKTPSDAEDGAPWSSIYSIHFLVLHFSAGTIYSQNTRNAKKAEYPFQLQNLSHPLRLLAHSKR